jgi:hypothetical protein
MKDEARIAEEYRTYRVWAESEIRRLKADVAFLQSEVTRLSNVKFDELVKAAGAAVADTVVEDGSGLPPDVIIEVDDPSLLAEATDPDVAERGGES